MVTAAAITFLTNGALVGGAAAAVATVADVIINFGPPPGPVMGRISWRDSRPNATRPPGGIVAPERQSEDRRAQGGCFTRYWDGWDEGSRTLTGGVGCGTCLEPDFMPRDMLLFDSTLKPRTGDVVLIEARIDGKPY